VLLLLLLLLLLCLVAADCCCCSLLHGLCASSWLGTTDNNAATTGKARGCWLLRCAHDNTPLSAAQRTYCQCGGSRLAACECSEAPQSVACREERNTTQQTQTQGRSATAGAA